MVAKMKLINPPTITNMGANNHVYFISQDMGKNMGRESQSSNKGTRAI